MYRLEIPITVFDAEHGDMRLTIEVQSKVDLVREFVSLGGDPDWIDYAANGARTTAVHGRAAGAIVQSMGGEVISDEPAKMRVETQKIGELNVPVSPGTPVAKSKTESPALAKDDPWGVPSTPGPKAAADDPWGADEDDFGKAAEPADTFAQEPAPTPAAPAPALKTTVDKYHREWTTGRPDAPDCQCGLPAVHMRAESKKTGNWYEKWKCQKGNTEDYKNKCSLDVFTDK